MKLIKTNLNAKTLTITLARPHVFNALNPEMIEEVTQLFIFGKRQKYPSHRC